MTEGKTSLYPNKVEESFQQEELDVRKSSPNTQRFRFLMLTLVVAGIIGYLIFSGMQDTMGYYLTVSELIEQGSQLPQENIRVSGNVSEGSVNWDPGERTLHFNIVDEKTTMPVVYQGLVPDSFKQGQKVIIEGVYADGVFTANELLTTCASKYE